jgi:hypothetical protein
MPKFRFAAAMAAILTACAISSADAGRLIPVPAVAGSTAMDVTAINNSNIITGVYETPDYVSHGFFGTLDGNYTTFDAGTFTVPLGINDQGLITGWNLAQDCSFTYPPVGCEFVRKLDSSIDIVTKDRSQIGGYAYGITTHARFVGEYWVARQTQGYDVFGYYGKGHKYVADVTLPFNTNHTSPRGINEAGTIIGHYIDLDAQRLRGFIVRGGVATAVDYPDPNADNTLFEGVNDEGLISGYWTSSQTTAEAPFLYDPAKGVFTSIVVRGATYVYPAGLNDAGLVTLDVDDVPYIYCSRKKTCPLGAGAIHVSEKWIRAKPADIHSVACRHDCMTPRPSDG